MRVTILLPLLMLCSGCTGQPEVPNTPPEAPFPAAGPIQHGSAPNQSGAQIQDPTGFPPFHSWPAPQGPVVPAGGAWSTPVQLTQRPGGGYRPQLALGVDDQIHALYYERTDEGDLIRHRRSTDGKKWTPPRPLGHTDERNWGPDMVTRADGSIVVVYDHALPDFRSRGYVTGFADERWSTPKALTPDDGGEVGSGHVANGIGDALAYVFIGKALGPAHRFQARWRWFKDGQWSPIHAFTDGQIDAWHTNVERRPDGSMLAGWDVGMGGGETQLYVAEGRDGAFGKPENISATSHPGERVHFAFGADGVDHLTWFHKEQSRPVHIYTRSGKPGRWGLSSEPSRGFGGYHFDPDIAVNARGVRCLVWGWDMGSDAQLVYSVDTGRGWSPPRRVAQLAGGKPGLPSLDVDSAGRFHVVWNQGVRGYNEVYYAMLEVQ
jgi:hypothetical protein